MSTGNVAGGSVFCITRVFVCFSEPRLYTVYPVLSFGAVIVCCHVETILSLLFPIVFLVLSVYSSGIPIQEALLKYSKVT